MAPILFHPSDQEEIKHHVHNVQGLPLATFEDRSFAVDGLAFVQTLELQPTQNNADKETPALAPISERPMGRKTAVLDFDETIFQIRVPGSMLNCNDTSSDASMHLRPFYKEFLELLLDRFELVVWTLSPKAASIQKCKWLGINLNEVPLLAGMDYCDECGNKPLYRLGREPNQVILIDDDKSHFRANPRSQLLVSAWRGDKGDEELMHALHVLEMIADADSVQDVLDVHIARSYRKNDEPTNARKT